MYQPGIESAGKNVGLDAETLRLDYAQTLTSWRALVDVRFRLLALVPTVTGLGVALLARRPGYEAALVAGLALVALFGIVIYDLRNSAFHDAAIHRAKQLEILLGAPWLSDKGKAGGLMNERPRERYRLFGVRGWHDRGLFLVYSASAAGWAALLCLGIISELNPTLSTQYMATAATAVVSFFVVLTVLHRYQAKVKQPRPRETADDNFS